MMPGPASAALVFLPAHAKESHATAYPDSRYPPGYHSRTTVRDPAPGRHTPQQRTLEGSVERAPTAGAFGRFETTEDVSVYTRAALLGAR
jgi:hypothetical protein